MTARQAKADIRKIDKWNDHVTRKKGRRRGKHIVCELNRPSRGKDVVVERGMGSKGPPKMCVTTKKL